MDYINFALSFLLFHIPRSTIQHMESDDSGEDGMLIWRTECLVFDHIVCVACQYG